MENIKKAFAPYAGLKRTSGNLAYSAGIRKAMEFDGTNDYVDCGTDSSLDLGSGSFTITAWVYPTSDTGAYAGIVTRRGGTGGLYMLAFHNGSSMRFYSHDGTDGISVNQSIQLNRWYFAVAVVDRNADVAKISVDGGGTWDTTSISTLGSIGSNSDPVRIGWEKANNTYFNGKIAQPRIFNYALSQSEIHQLYNGKDIRNDGLVGYWKLDKITNSQTLDETDNNNHGTINGNPSITSLEDKAGRTLITKMYNMGKPNFPYGVKFPVAGDDYILKDNITIGSMNTWSIGAWVKVDNPTTSTNYYCSIRTNNDRPALSVHSDGSLYAIYTKQSDGNAAAHQSPVDVVIPSTWNYIVWTGDGSNTRWYANGELVDTKNQDIQFVFNRLFLGMRNGGNGLDGQISNFYFYNRALSQSEIQANMYKRLKGNEPGLVFYAPLDEGEGRIAHDKTANQNHGTFQGNPQWVSPFNPEYYGDKQAPEYHKTLDGVHQVAIEKFGKNFLRNNTMQVAVVGVIGSGGSMPDNWSEQNHSGITREITAIGEAHGYEYIEIKFTSTEVNTSYRLNFEGTSSGANSVPAVQNDNFAFSLYAEIISSEQLISNVNLRIAERDSNSSQLTVQTGSNFISDIADIKRHTQPFTISHVDTAFITPHLNGAFSTGDNFTIRIYVPQIESGLYATSVIRTSGATVERPAPLVPINDAVPETGTIAGVVDTIRTDNTGDNAIFWGGGIVAEGGIGIRISQSTNNIILNLFNSDQVNLSIAGDMIPINQRGYYSVLLNYSLTDFVFAVMSQNGNVYLTKSAYNRNTEPSHYDMVLGSSPFGNNTSKRFEIPLYKDDTIRVNATDDEIKQFFEDLTRGTSMQTKKEDMTIV